MNWPRAHWFVGSITLALFPLAGVYMRFIAKVPQLADAPRLVYRSRFLFLLLIAIANLALSRSRPDRFMQRMASIIVLLAPAPMVVAFFIEPPRGVRSSLWTVTTMRALFVAAVLLALSYRPKNHQSQRDQAQANELITPMR
jgi:hypothetical protein